MDYLDPAKEQRHRILLFTGYVLTAIAIAMAAIIMFRVASGYGLDKDGQVIQNALTYFSSHPNPADIYVNNKLESVKTNTRLYLPAGIYDIKLARNGYYDWQRKIELNGGKVEHFDYPFLFPKILTTNKLRSFNAAPGLAAQSPDHRWLLIQPGASLRDLLVFDLKNPQKEPLAIKLADSLLTSGSAENWQFVEWSGDNRRVVLRHIFDGKTEYILVDRTAGELSLNLNTTLSAAPSKLSLSDKKYDQYYLYDSAALTLQAASISVPSPAPVLQRVLAYKTYGSDTVLYVTDKGAATGKVFVKLKSGTQTTTVRTLTAGTNYVLDLTKYDGSMYVAVGSAGDNRVYVYKDPAGQVLSHPELKPVSSQVLHVEGVNYLSFSASAQFIVAENGNRFGVYDIENESGYNYSTTAPLDTPQLHANWMEGNRLYYISGGKLLVFDYDNLNSRVLMPAGSQYLPAFAPDYKFVYGLAPTAAAGQFDLTQTSLLAPADR